MLESPNTVSVANKKPALVGILVGLVIAVALLFAGLQVVLRRATPILKSRITKTLSQQFNARVELDDLQVTVLRGLEVEGGALRIYPLEGVVASGAKDPLITLEHFSFHSGIAGLFSLPMHVSQVQVRRLMIVTPPHGLGQDISGPKTKKHGRPDIVVDEIICADSRLTIGTRKPDKDPRDFELRRIVLRHVGPTEPWQYDATLTNAIPRGDIQASGTFGPWQTESPGDSPVTGHYTFEHADLNTIRGIGGNLSSVGDFKGQLNRISIDGTTETPNFSLDTANHPLPLHTRFHAIVDGTSGDTYLQPVDATLGESHFTTSGSVINIKGKGHQVDLDLDVKNCRLQDFLALAVKTTPPVMTGIITTQAKLQIGAGHAPVPDKIGLVGGFELRRIHFTSPDVQDKVDMMSLRAQGKPEEAKPNAPDVGSRIDGKFTMGGGVLQFSNLIYTLPGAQVNMEGEYSLDGQEFEFHGKVLTSVSLSHMVSSRWKSFLLEPASLIFKRRGGGADIPVSISGTQGKPKFGVDLFRHHENQKKEK